MPERTAELAWSATRTLAPDGGGVPPVSCATLPPDVAGPRQSLALLDEPGVLAAGDGGDHRDRGSLCQRGIEPIGEPNVLIINVDIHETA